MLICSVEDPKKDDRLSDVREEEHLPCRFKYQTLCIVLPPPHLQALPLINTREVRAYTTYSSKWEPHHRTCLGTMMSQMT
jgi:hypothetical protein